MLDINAAIERFSDWLWRVDTASVPKPEAWGISTLRAIFAIGREMATGQLTLQAMGLVYTTLLSLVPLLALTFSVLKGFGVHNQLEPVLATFLAPLGDKGVDITQRILGFVENIRVGLLGALGLGFLIYTVTSLIQKIERAFNYAWRVEHTRPFAQRFSQYLSVLTIGPVLVFSAIGITASVMGTSAVQSLIAIEPIGTVIAGFTRLIPYLLVISAFTFLYMFIPNTRVRFTSAAIAGVIAGVLWQTTGWIFATFVVASTKYTAIYSGFAILIMFMIWLYISWLILLVGTNIAFFHQHPAYLPLRRRELKLSARLREQLGLLVMAGIVRRFYASEPPPTGDQLARELNAPFEAVISVTRAMRKHRLINETGDDPPALIPAQPPEQVPLTSLMDAVRRADEDTHLAPEQLTHRAAIDALVAGLDQQREEALRGRTLRDLAVAPAATGKPGS